MNKIIISIFITLLLVGCTSLLQTESLQSVIRKPVNYCKLNQAYHKVVTLEDAPIYDDQKCYTNFHRIVVDRKLKGNSWDGTLNLGVGVGWDYVHFLLPTDFKWKPPFSAEHLPDEWCILAGTSSFGWKTPYVDSEKDMERGGGEINIVKIVKKQKLTLEQRKKKKEEIQEKIDEEYNKKQKHYNYEYEECNNNHKIITKVYQQEKSIKKFCQSIQYTWFTRHCLANKDDTEECKTLKDLFIDCYRQGAMKVDDTYVRITFFS